MSISSRIHIELNIHIEQINFKPMSGRSYISTDGLLTVTFKLNLSLLNQEYCKFQIRLKVNVDFQSTYFRHSLKVKPKSTKIEKSAVDIGSILRESQTGINNRSICKIHSRSNLSLNSLDITLITSFVWVL